MCELCTPPQSNVLFCADLLDAILSILPNEKEVGGLKEAAQKRIQTHFLKTLVPKSDSSATASTATSTSGSAGSQPAKPEPSSEVRDKFWALVKRGCAQLVNALMSAFNFKSPNFDIHSKDDSEHTPLTIAIEKGRHELAKVRQVV